MPLNGRESTKGPPQPDMPSGSKANNTASAKAPVMTEPSASSQGQDQITPSVGNRASKKMSSCAVLSSHSPEQFKRGFGTKLKDLIITPFMKCKQRRNLKKKEEELSRRINARPEVKALMRYHLTRREWGISMAQSYMDNVASQFALLQMRLGAYNLLDDNHKCGDWGRLLLSWATRDIDMMEWYANSALSYVQELERDLSQLEELILQM